jgi:hypothetical protein
VTVEHACLEDIAVPLVTFENEVGRAPLEIKGASPKPMPFVGGNGPWRGGALRRVSQERHLLNIK